MKINKLEVLKSSILTAWMVFMLGTIMPPYLNHIAATYPGNVLLTAIVPISFVLSWALIACRGW